ncbi:hypothetical protein KM043_005163 [Ampulex compressa]|nr:hypothetical protein KM043_005163 [Ampulex compressa]
MDDTQTDREAVSVPRARRRPPLQDGDQTVKNHPYFAQRHLQPTSSHTDLRKIEDQPKSFNEIIRITPQITVSIPNPSSSTKEKENTGSHQVEPSDAREAHDAAPIRRPSGDISAESATRRRTDPLESWGKGGRRGAARGVVRVAGSRDFANSPEPLMCVGTRGRPPPRSVAAALRQDHSVPSPVGRVLCAFVATIGPRPPRSVHRGCSGKTAGT